MKRTTHQIILIIISLIILIQFMIPSQAIFTVIPGEIKLSALNRGQTIERKISIYNLENYTIQLTIKPTGEGSNWISFFNQDDHNLTSSITSIQIPGKNTGNNLKTLQVIISIPQEAANKNYSPIIDFVYNPPSNESMAIGFILSTYFQLEVTGIEIKSGVVKSIAVNKLVEIGTPLDIYVQFENDGNVQARPEILVNIKRNDKIIDSISYDDAVIEPEIRDTIEMTWDTSIGVPGNYTAAIAVFLDETKLGEDNISFEILPYGAITEGQLFNLSYSGSLTPDKTIKIRSDFQNTGSYEVLAKFIGEIYKEGDLIETIETPEFLVPGWGTHSFESFFKIPEQGIYTIQGYVLYSNKKSNIMSLDLQVGTEISAQLIAFLVVGVFIFLFSFYLFKIRFRSGSKRYSIGFTKNAFASRKADKKPQIKVKTWKSKPKKQRKITTRKKPLHDNKYDEIERIIDQF